MRRQPIRHGRLARAAEAADGDQAGRSSLKRLYREIVIGACRGRQALITTRLLGLRRRYMGAHGRAQRREERQERKALLLARRIAIAVGDEVRVILQATMPEIHDEKGEIVENVDGRDAVVEIDAVEETRLAVEKAEIAQMQIAVAEADFAALARRSRCEAIVQSRLRKSVSMAACSSWERPCWSQSPPC